MARVVAIGEVMVEFARGEDGRYGLSVGGDTFNAAVYLARAGVATAYATALGDDAYSDAIVALAAAEGVETALMHRRPGRMPGLYTIETDPGGERRFAYWRDTSPARELFEAEDWGTTAAAIAGSGLAFLSGITLSLYSNTGLGRLLATLEALRARGGKVVFDGNFRPRGWKGDTARARMVYAEALKRTDIALPTFDDEVALWGDASPAATIARLQAFGIGEVAVKRGVEPCVVAAGGATEEVPIVTAVKPVDTTAAGDSFDAAYLAARLTGAAPAAAAAAGHRLAGHVVRHRGAIVPREGVMH
jgi:2-dehydro-3-deoxygluconokinase